jgi:hypothetical protein
MKAVHKNIHTAIIGEIAKAEQSIKINVPWFTSIELFQAILDASQNGVEVRLVIEDDEINRNTSINHADLVSKNGHLYWHKKSIGVNHEKYCLIDNKTLIFGSFNWTYNAIKNNLESVIIIEQEIDGGNTIEDFNILFDNILKSPDVTPEKREEEIGRFLVNQSSLLKVQLHIFETECAILQEQVTEISSFYQNITNQINRRLFEYILRKLQLNRILADYQAEKTKKRVDAEKASQLNDEANRWEQWKEKFGDAVDDVVVYKGDELKQLYYKAALLAHPDKFIDDPVKQEKATEIMQAITQAYQNNDADALRDILLELETGYAFDKKYDHINDTYLLQRILTKLMTSRDSLLIQLDELKQNNLYPIYCLKVDQDEYLENMKRQLEKDIAILEKNVKQLKNG